MRVLAAMAAFCLIASPAFAQTVQTYQYDVRGRLVKVIPSAGDPTTYTYDAVDNRMYVLKGTLTPPVATDDVIYATPDNCPTSFPTYYGLIGVLHNDAGTGLRITSVVGSTGSFSIYGLIPYSEIRILWSGPADPGFHDVLEYTVTDAAGQTDTAQLDIIWSC